MGKQWKQWQVLFSWAPKSLQMVTAAKSLQSCPTLCNPIDGSPSGSPVPGILQSISCKNTGVGCHFLLQCMKVKSESEVAQSCLTLFFQGASILILWLQSLSAGILESKKVKSVTVSIFSPSICHEMMGPDPMILGCWILGFKPGFSLSSFTFIKRLFSSPSLSAIRVVSSAYLGWLIFLPAILIPACDSSSPAFHMMHCLQELNGLFTLFPHLPISDP